MPFLKVYPSVPLASAQLLLRHSTPSRWPSSVTSPTGRSLRRLMVLGPMLLTGLVLCASPCRAETPPFKINSGQIAITGIVSGVNTEGREAKIVATWFAGPDGVAHRVPGTPEKLLEFDSGSVIIFPAAPGSRTLGDIAPNVTVTAVGKDLGPGAILPVSQVLVWASIGGSARVMVGDDGRTATITDDQGNQTLWDMPTGKITGTVVTPPDKIDGRPYDYARIDGAVANAPGSALVSVDSLAKYLATEARNEREKARAAFIWIAKSVAWDLEGVRRHTAIGAIEQPQAVFKARLGDSEGQARLFAALARGMGLNAEVVEGGVRSADPDPSLPADPRSAELSKHFWSAVQLYGAWELLDVSEAGGLIRENGTINQARPTDDDYFLPTPEHLIYTHLPQQERWQLVDHPISQQDQAKLPFEQLAFFRYDLHGTDLSPSLTADGRVALSLQAPPGVSLFAQLFLVRKPAGDRLTFTERLAGNYAITALLPGVGNYELQVLARRFGESTRRDALNVRVNARTAAPFGASLPVASDAFEDHNGTLLSPGEGVVTAGNPLNFRIMLPGALQVFVYTGSHYVPLQPEGDGVFSGYTTVDAGSPGIVAEFPDAPGQRVWIIHYRATERT